MKHLLEFGLFRVDPEQRVLLRGDEPIPLTPKAFDLLLLLMERSGQVVLKDDLMRLLWPDTFVEESNLGQHVFQLRKALGERAQGSSYIVTVPGRGYRFAHAVRTLPDQETILVASHTRSRMVVEQTVHDGNIDQNAWSEVLPVREMKALPPHLALRWYRGPIAALILAGALLGALAVWIFFFPSPMPKVLRSVQITQSGRVDPLSQTLSDGSRIFFTERTGGSDKPAWASEQGGEPVLIATSLQHITMLDIDRHRGRLLVNSPSPSLDQRNLLWSLPTAGGSPRRIGDVMADFAAWSPDGERIVYCKDSDVYLVSDDGLQPRKLFSAPGVVEYLRWSPDGQRISFSVIRTKGTLELWEIRSDGSDAHALAFGWKSPTIVFGEGECCGDWSPDGRYFLFRSHRDGVESVWLYRERNGWFGRGRSQPVLLYTSPARMNEPRFSADGKKIFFVSYQERRELVRYDASRKMFVSYLSGMPARHLSFSRDGQWVAYKNEANHTLWRSRVDGTQALQLTFPPLDVYHPTWSPDGERIAFEGNGNLYTVPVEGGNIEPLIPIESNRDRQPSWSPDGKSIVFNHWSQAAGSQLAIVDWGTRQVQLLPDTQRFECPQWSPDGRYIAAASRPHLALMLYDVGSRRWSKLAEGTPYGWGIRWSSDSQYVYYQHTFASEEQPIFRVRVNDHKVEQVTTSRDLLRADVMSGLMTGLTPDNSPLLSLTHTTSDVQALELDLP